MTETGSEESRSERKRRHILVSATAMFAKEGFAHAGMEQIARDAGVSTATLYAYFPSKGDLFRVVVEDAIAGIAARVRDSAELPGDAWTRLTGFGVAYAEFYANPTSRALFRMVIAERRRFPDLADHFQDRGRDELGGSALKIIHDLVGTGELEVEKASWAAGQLQGMIEHSTLLLGLVGGDGIRTSRPIEAIVEDCVTTFLARYGVKERAA